MNRFTHATLRHRSLLARGLRVIASTIVVTLWTASCGFRGADGTSAPNSHLARKVAQGATATKQNALNLALVQAVKKRSASEVKALLARGANPNAHDNSAFKDWQKQMAQLVKEQDFATGAMRTHPRGEGARPYLGPTALMIAAYQGDNATIQQLVGAGADANAGGVDYGAASAAASDWTLDLETRVTPLIEAMFSGQASTMRLLIKKGALVNGRDSQGLTALDWAYNMTPTFEPTPQRKAFLDKIFHVLREAGAKRSQDA